MPLACLYVYMDDKTKKLLNLAFKYLSQRAHTIHEMKIYLQKRDASSEQTELIIQKLLKLKFLDDALYARQWIEERKNLRPRSYNFIKLELQKKGIARDLLDQIFTEKKDTGEKSRDESEMAQILAQKVIKRNQKLPMEEKREKLLRYLSSRGFSWDIIRKVIDGISKKE